LLKLTRLPCSLVVGRNRRRSCGEAVIAGHTLSKAAAEVKRAIGIVPQDIALYPTLSARENLSFWGQMYGLGGAELKRRVAEVLETVGLRDRCANLPHHLGHARLQRRDCTRARPGGRVAGMRHTAGVRSAILWIGHLALQIRIAAWFALRIPYPAGGLRNTE
jgi:hypothetical protein